MPNNNQSEEVERVTDTILDALYDGGVLSYSMKARRDVETIVTTHGASEYARGIKDAIKLSDELEASDTEFNEWRAFKGFRNALRDKLQALSQENTLKE